MADKTKAEEYAEKNYPLHPQEFKPFTSQNEYNNYMLRMGFVEGYNSRQSEIAELNLAVERLMKSRHELQDEVERLRKEMHNYIRLKTL
jgi:uncharacterized protein YhaN